jgi:hypothetical protein
MELIDLAQLLLIAVCGCVPILVGVLMVTMARQGASETPADGPKNPADD